MQIYERPRRLRTTAGIRDLVRETVLTSSDLVLPVFVCSGSGTLERVADLPVVQVVSVDKLTEHLRPQVDLGLKSVLLFARIDDTRKTPDGSEALNPDGLILRAIREIRATLPDLTVMTDIALDPYTTHGHDGRLVNDRIVNDPTVEVLAAMALMHAQAGAHLVAPSDMMDGRVGGIRAALDAHGYDHVGIMSYTAKYASCLYGPFRSILASAPRSGNKKTYQMDPGNAIEAERELRLDLEEGADIVMVKPALWYLDVVHRFASISDRPVAAYHTSGEASMILHAAQQGQLQLADGIVEATTAIKRAGASIIVTYFSRELLTWISTR
jgi:porphobilinogen synthase